MGFSSSQFSLQSPTITCVPLLPRPNGPNITSNPRGFCPSSHLLSLTRGQAVVWPKFSASGCEISLNVPPTSGLAVILEKLGKSETRHSQREKETNLSEQGTKYIMDAAISEISQSSPTRMIYANLRSIISKCFHLSSAPPPHTMFPLSPCFHFTAAIGKACFAQTLGLVKFFAASFQRRQQ